MCLKLCRLLELGKGISLDFRFRCYGNQNQNECLLLKKQKVYCLSNLCSNSNLKQYSLITAASSVKFWRKIGDTLLLLWENNSLLFFNKGQLFSFELPQQRYVKSCCSLQNFQQIRQKTPEILHFHFFSVLHECVYDVIFEWKRGWKSIKWRRPSCSDSWIWNGISRESFGALKSVIAHFCFAFFTLCHLSYTFFRLEFPFKDTMLSQMSGRVGWVVTVII